MIILLCLPSRVAAQAGSIAGVVVDAETGETLIGANVVIAGTSVGSTSDLVGRYRIDSIDPGVYDLTFSYIGFASRTVRNVEVKADLVTTLDLGLAPAALGLAEVVVEAAAVRSVEAALLRDRQKAPVISDAISADAMSRAGSSTASDAMERVIGASVVDGKYVSVRGLGDRYVKVRLNGSSLPSADPDRNTVPLDLFPAGLLDNIITSKTFAPDGPGSATGGTIDIGTRAFPEQFMLSFSTSAGYNSQTTGSNRFLTYDTGRTDWLGYDDGTRQIAEAWQDPSVSSPNHIQARRDPAMARELDRLSRSFSAEMAPRATIGPVETSHSFSIGDQTSLLGKPLGFLGSLNYDRDFSSYTDGRAATYLLTGRVSEVDQLNLQQDLSDARSTSDVLWGGLGTLSYRPHLSHSLGATIIYTRGGTSEARYLVGPVPRNFAPERRLESRVLSFTERVLRSLQLGGEHVFASAGGIRADWSVARALTQQDEPDVRHFANDFAVYERDGRLDTLYAVAVSNYTAPTRYFRTLSEDGLDGALNLTLPFRSGATSGSVKAGTSGNFVRRTFNERRFEYVLRTPYDGDPAAFFSQVGLVDSTRDANGVTYEVGNYLVDASSPRNNYDGDQEVIAGYGMIELRFSGGFRAVGGVRYEHTTLDVVSNDSSISAARLRNADWLPSLNLVYELGKANFRVAYGKTLARPTFRELAPFTSFAYINAPTITGNPNLRRTLVHNVDARWEWFMSPGEVLAVSGFYKRFLDPIERTILNNNFETRFENVERADVYGFELEARKQLYGLWRPLRAVEVGANLTVTRSLVDIPKEEMEQIHSLNPNANRSRPLQGQSPYVVNADLTYNAQTTTISLLYNVFGRRLSDVSLGGTPDIYELPFHSLDLTAMQRLFDRVRLRAAVRNLLNGDVRRAYPFRGQAYYAAVHTQGRSVSISLTLAF